ncbi:carboxypeptidase regulatory-like domain-containing protein [Telmatobacter bradus]|uniref:carboxypeptidase regulatory-like domain-containing protein n=1 Tax=Telmatobacter bradus TaxID=474953 RepID=UPI003B42AB0B
MLNFLQNMRNRAHQNTGLQIVLFVLLAAIPAFAQVEKGLITGQVKDASSAVIGQAHVKLKNIATGIVTDTTSDGQGIFVSPPLTPGDYDVQVNAPGFKSVLKHVRLEVAQRISAEFVLAIGGATETVEVEATTVQFDTDTSTVSNLRTQEAVRNLPLNGRNFTELLGLGAGVVPGQSQLAGSIPYAQQRGPSAYVINGQRLTDNRFLLDGIGDNENHNGLGVIIFPPIDAVEEFREETTDADARYGRAAGGVINVVFKSGSNQYHGEVFDFLRNSSLDAKNYYDAAKPGFRMNSFGATFGGPLWHQKNPRTFFFADYAGQRTGQGLTYISTVPDWGPQGVGDFSYYSTTVKNPTTGTAFSGNVIPSSYLTSAQSIVGQNILALFSKYASPNIAGTTTANNYRYSPQRIDNSNAYDVKVDHQFWQSDNAFVRFSHSYDDILQPGTLPTPLVGANISGPAQQPAYQAVLSETHILSPSLLNTVRFGWSRIFIAAQNFDQGLGLSTTLGIPGVIQSNDVAHTDGLPVLSTTGISSIGDASNSPAQIGTNNYQSNDNVSWLHGKHSFDFGVEIVRLQYNMYQTAAEHGTMAFTGNFTGLGLADLLLGAPYSGTYEYQQGTRGFRQLDLSGYVQDSYKLNSRVTLNLGLRYDNFLGWPWTEVNNKMYQFDPSISTTQVFQVGSNGVSRSGANGQNLNFSPRVGISARIFEKTSFHAGYGIYYEAPTVTNSSGLSMNAPAIDYWAFNNANGYAATGFNWVSNGFTHTRDTTGAPQGAPLFAQDPHAKTPYSEQWHASIQQQIGSTNRITIAYVGNVGVHLQGLFDINQATPGTTALSTRRPYPYFAQIWQLKTALVSNYSGLQVTAERRGKNLSYLASYTYSHALDENSNNLGTVVNSYNPHADYGNSDNNIPNRFAASVNYTLPFTHAGRLKPVVEGWQVNAIATYSDGIPFSITTGSNSLGISDAITTRAKFIGTSGNGALPTGQRTIKKWFNTADFSNPGTDNWSDYNSGRNILQGPGTKDIDFSLFKHFVIKQAQALELRAETFNLFNTPQFNNPSAVVGTSTFGTISSAGSPTTLQRTSREIQVAAKYTF